MDGKHLKTTFSSILATYLALKIFMIVVLSKFHINRIILCFSFLCSLTMGCQRKAEYSLPLVSAAPNFEKPFTAIFTEVKNDIDSNFIIDSVVVLLEIVNPDEVRSVILDKGGLEFLLMVIEEPFFGYLEFQGVRVLICGHLSDHFFIKASSLKRWKFSPGKKPPKANKNLSMEEPPIIFEPIMKVYRLEGTNAVLERTDYY